MLNATFTRSSARNQRWCHICEIYVEPESGSFGMESHMSSLAVYRKHMKIISQKANYKINYKCDVCGQNFQTLGDLTTHMKSIHDQVKKHKCFQCGLSFFQNDTLTNHIESVHGESSIHKCELCEKSFYRSAGLERHIELFH